MLRTRSPLLPCALACCLALALLSGCGGSNESLVELQGNSASISKATLNHWMRANVGADFRATIGTKAPFGLVSEPADYSKCAEAARKIVPRSFTGQLKLSGAEIDRKCHLLYEAVKAQALSFLILVQWSVIDAAKQGLHVSDAMLHKELTRFRRERYPTEADFQTYLTDRRWTVSDVLYEFKMSILVRKLLPGLQARVKAAGGGEATYGRLVLERYQARVAKTSCKAGYVVQGCKEYREGSAGPPAPNVLLEGFVQG